MSLTVLKLKGIMSDNLDQGCIIEFLVVTSKEQKETGEVHFNNLIQPNMCKTFQNTLNIKLYIFYVLFLKSGVHFMQTSHIS